MASHRFSSGSTIDRFDIAALTDKEFADLDVGYLILNNYRRYRQAITDIIGPLTEFEEDDLAGIFWDICHVEIGKVKAAHLNSTGEERKIAILGILKSMARTRVMEYICKQRESLKVDPELSYEDGGAFFSCPKYKKNSPDEWAFMDFDQHRIANDPAERMMFAAEAVVGAYDEESDEEFVNLERIESIRHLFPHKQYSALVELAQAGFSTPVKEVADDIGCSDRKYYARLASARLKMWEHLPQHKQAELEHCLKRKHTR